MAKKGYDFSGWATRYDVKCSDGRTIRKDAFKHNDGKKVSLVWQHRHDDPEDVLGYGILEHCDEGERLYGYLNNSRKALAAKENLKHGDIFSLSIYAGNVTERNGNVLHGDIKEVSLVISPANPEAHIDIPYIEHSDDGELEAYIDFGYEMCECKPGGEDIQHSDDTQETQKTQETQETTIEHADMPKNMDDIIATFTDEQKDLFYFLLGVAQEGELKQSDISEEEDAVKTNVFENEPTNNMTITQSDIDAVFKDAKRLGSLRDAVQHNIEEGGAFAHAVYNDDDDHTQQLYGTANINYLFPEYKDLNTPPDFIKRDTGWVSTLMNGVHRTPFARIRSRFADITMEEARAKGYIKGKKKQDEVFTLLKRTTDPQTVYKKQRADRDDIIDITDFSYVSFLKGEMRGMLDEEIARACLIGDGRLTAADDKISEDHIRPILTDSTTLFVIRKEVEEQGTPGATIKKLMEAFIRARKDYKGSGSLTLFTTEDFLCDMLLLEDGIGHRLYKSESELATFLRVKNIVTVPVMENLQRGGNDVIGIAVDLRDYTIGADKGGAVSMFEDFDIDYNQMKYLIETRCSGALTKPFSAIVVEKVPAGEDDDGEDDQDDQNDTP